MLTNKMILTSLFYSWSEYSDMNISATGSMTKEHIENTVKIWYVCITIQFECI